MDEEKVGVSTNWCLLRGKNISESLVIKTFDNYSSEAKRPSIDDIVSFEQSIHLQQPLDNNEDNQLNFTKKVNCNINFEINSTYCIKGFTLVTDCQKLEMFMDVHNEYFNTFIGEFLDDFDGMRVYRFDIELTKKISQFLLKLIPRVPEIWIYGIQVVVDNDETIDIASPLHNINLDNVKSILSSSNHKLTPKAIECKSFIENFLHGTATKTSNLDDTSQFMKWPPEFENFKTLLGNTNKLSIRENTKEDSYSKIDELKKYIDKVMHEMENKFSLQLQALEKRQNEKLDKIIEILSTQETKLCNK